MSLTFTKLFSSITDSSIWSESSDTKVVWITLLAMADQFGRVHAAIPGLAKRAGVHLKSTETALRKFKAPDAYSRTKDHEGRRIEDIEGGWQILNHQHYRDLSHEEDRKEQLRKAQATFREKQARNQPVINSNQPSSKVSPIEADTDTKADTDKKRRVGGFSEDFLEFWEEYPNKKAKPNAWKAWQKIAPKGVVVSMIIQAVREQKTWDQWTKDGGAFIPHPASWLNANRWEDENRSAPLPKASSASSEAEASRRVREQEEREIEELSRAQGGAR